jgi:RES domain-containing protein
MRNRRKRTPNQRRDSSSDESGFPSLLELERFGQTSLHKWLGAKRKLDLLQRALYFELEPLRQAQEVKLLDALRSRTRPTYQFHGWSRIVDYRYSLEPLSNVGSFRGDGGRFNIGAELSPGTFTPFPALYVAEDYDTAFNERFGRSEKPRARVLSTDDLALRVPGSFTQVRLNGSVEQLMDISDLEALTPFTEILKDFQVPKVVLKTARQLGLRQTSWLIRSPSLLQRKLLDRNWRMVPAQFDLPSNSQIFGRLAVAAGLHGIVYPSTKHAGKRCMALFTQNWPNGRSFVEVSDPAPEGAVRTRISGSN